MSNGKPQCLWLKDNKYDLFWITLSGAEKDANRVIDSTVTDSWMGKSRDRFWFIALPVSQISTEVRI
jgi:hypothetical protein